MSTPCPRCEETGVVVYGDFDAPCGLCRYRPRGPKPKIQAPPVTDELVRPIREDGAKARQVFERLARKMERGR